MAAFPRIKPDRPGLIDACGRRIDHLRVSVTSACDLCCVYCRPDVRVAPARRGLTDEQRIELIRFLHETYGLAQVRVTGGEPLLHPGLVSFVAGLRHALPGVQVALTTNGRRLAEFAPALRAAGLERLNVSLDSLDPRRYRRITGGDLGRTLAGIEAATAAGFPPPRINTVVLRDVNERELVPLAEWALLRGSEIRYLEAMPIGPAQKGNRRGFVSMAEVHGRLQADFKLTPIPRVSGETARRYRAEGRNCAGHIGLIAPLSEPFCAHCRRMRLTADGKLYACLLDSRSVDLRSLWRAGALCRDAAAARIATAASSKRAEGRQRQPAAMTAIGG